jgi:hypothetical protein
MLARNAADAQEVRSKKNQSYLQVLSRLSPNSKKIFTRLFKTTYEVYPPQAESRISKQTRSPLY